METWWTNLGESDREIIALYHAHGECEQFHSEVKTDMDLERLPSGKFETNALVLELGMVAYNILRMIGQGTIGKRAPRQKRDVRRRRLHTVIENLVMMSAHVTTHARKLMIGFVCTTQLIRRGCKGDAGGDAALFSRGCRGTQLRFPGG